MEAFLGHTVMALGKPKLSYWRNQQRTSRATKVASTATADVKE